MEVLIKDVANENKLNPDQLVAFAKTYNKDYSMYDPEAGVDNAVIELDFSTKLVSDFIEANKDHDWRQDLTESQVNKIIDDMTNLNEDGLNILNPDLLKNWLGKDKIKMFKDQMILKLQKQIGLLDQQKMKIEKEQNQIAAKDAQEQGKDAKDQDNQPEQPTDANGNPQQQVQVAGTPVNNESLLVSSMHILEQIDDEILYYQLRLQEVEEDRFTGMHGDLETNYELNKDGRPIKRKETARTPGKRKPKVWGDTKLDKYDQFDRDIRDMEDQIEDLESEMEYKLADFQSPSFDGASGEIEEFFSQIGFSAADIVNSGISDKDKLSSLKKLGVEDPEDTLETYYYYYPEFNHKLDKPKKEADKEVRKIQVQIDKLTAKIEKKHAQREKMGSPVYDYDVYDSYNPMSSENFYDMSEAYIENPNTEKKTKMST